jgi:hypothetical protein
MGKKVEIPFAGPAYTMRSLQLDAQNCINWYMTIDQLGKYKTALLPRPGLLLYFNDNAIEQPIFIGSGLNDLTVTGSYTGTDSTYFWLKIDVVGTPDKFILSEDGGETWIPTQIPITGDYQDLLHGVVIKFNATTGHSLNNYWIINAHHENSVRGMLPLNDALYVVIDNKFYIYRSNRDRELISQIKTTTGPIRLLTNDYQVAVFDGRYGYVYQVIATQYHDVNTFFEINNSSSTISTPVFSGTGANNMSVSGIYTGDVSKTYVVKIDGFTTVDTFKWSNDNGVTWIATSIPITGGLQFLEEGIYVSFITTTAHDLNDDWTFLAEVSSSFYPPIVPAYQDGYGIYPRQNSQRFYYTAIEDFSRVDPLAYESAIIYADYIAGAASMNQELYMIGTDSVQIYHTSSNADLPFAPRTNFVLNYGCIAPYTIQVGSNNIIFMLARNKSGDRIIIIIENYNVKTISTEPLMDELSTYDTVDDAFASIIEMSTNIFYLISFPSADKTWVYNLKMDQWSQWASEWPNGISSPLPTRQGMFRASCHAVFDGKNVVGDLASGRLFSLSNDIILDNATKDLNSPRENLYIGTPVTCQRTGPHLYGDDDWITLNSLIIDVQRGGTEINAPITLCLQVSRDGGQTWGSEMWRNTGATGNYTHRALWTNLGTARVFTFRLTTSDPGYIVILGMVADIEGNE